jgi:deoxycytidylate deaminase
VLAHYPLLVSYWAEFCKVAHHDFGAVLAEDLRVVAPGYTDHEAEAAGPTRMNKLSSRLLLKRYKTLAEALPDFRPPVMQGYYSTYTTVKEPRT